MSSVELVVDPDDPNPPFEQLRLQFERLIRSGTFTAGERLPPVRQLAADLGLAPGTVARTYKELESKGLTETSRGGGTRVADSITPYSGHDLSTLLKNEANTYFTRAKALGATNEDLVAAVVDAVDRVE